VRRLTEAAISDMDPADAASVGADVVSIPFETAWRCGRSAVSPLVLGLAAGEFVMPTVVADGLATAIDVVLARVAASTQSRLTAVLQEKARIASDIHEGVSQELATISLQLEVLSQLTTEAPQVRELAGLTRATTRRAIASVREAILDLVPLVPRGDAVAESMQAFVADFASRWALDISFAVEGIQQEVESDVLALACAFLQETLTNLRKYAAALKGDVQVAFGESVLTVKVRSTGTANRKRPTVDSTGQGIQLMTARARLLGGDVLADEDQNGGREVMLQIPI